MSVSKPRKPGHFEGTRTSGTDAMIADAAHWRDTSLERRVQAGRRQLLARAVGLHRARELHICDATAGFGRDACVFAGLGARVDCVERNTEVLKRLHDTLEGLPESVRARITVLPGEAASRLAEGMWDVIYLDPMFTPTGKRALPQAVAQALRAITVSGADDDAAMLLPLARRHARRRVVVKRALRAPTLGGQRPAERLRGNSVRFDIYLPLPAEAP